MDDLVTITEIEKTGEDDFFEATLSFRTHSEAIVVIGSTLDICVRRAIIIADAFNRKGAL